MFSFFNSFGANTNFQRYRLQLTAKSFDNLNQITLRSWFSFILDIMKTFCSEDKETRAQIAFATIIKKLLTSESRGNWIYILKNILILDRVIEQGVFIQQINQTSIETIDNFKETDYKYILFDTERMIKTYWKLMKERTNSMKTHKHIFCYKRSQRQDYLASLSAGETLRQIQSIENIFTMTFQLVDVLSGNKLMSERPNDAQKIKKAREQFTKSKLIEYIYLQILHKFMLYYSCQLLCNNYFLQLLIRSKRDVTTEEIRRYRKHIIKFKTNADEYIMFIEKNKTIKGFQELNYKELNPFQKEQILKIIDKLLLQQQKPENDLVSHIDQTFIGKDVLKVEKRTHNGSELGILFPRIKIKKGETGKKSTDSKDSKQNKLQTNPFNSWINAYSGQFPQKQIMTVDLITLLKQEQQNNQQQDFYLEDVIRETNLIFYDLRETNVTVNYELNLKSDKTKSNQFFFKNIYSSLPSNWNSH